LKVGDTFVAKLSGKDFETELAKKSPFGIVLQFDGEQFIEKSSPRSFMKALGILNKLPEKVILKEILGSESN